MGKNMQMGKRLLQSGLVLGMLGAMCVWAAPAAAESGKTAGNAGAGAAGGTVLVGTAERNLAEGEDALVQQAGSGRMYHEVGDGSTVTILDEVIALSEEAALPEVEPAGDDSLQEPVPVMGELYSAETPKLVGIDPGHMGYTAEKYFNTGAESVYGTIEYQWTLEISKLLSEELAERGYDVYLLRTTNELKEYPYNNGQRARAANAMGCDILVAIHWDSSVDEETRGYHTIYKGKKTTADYRLAKAVSDSYGEAVAGAIEKFSNPISRSNLWELNVAEMPCIIVECGYSSNREEATWLEDKQNYETIVRGIADGIDAYFEGERE